MAEGILTRGKTEIMVAREKRNKTSREMGVEDEVTMRQGLDLS
jgi:hypothetical protein